MNFKIILGHLENTISFGKILYDQNDLFIESDFGDVIVRRNPIGTIICLGEAKCKDDATNIELFFDTISENSFSSAIYQLEGRFLLLFVKENGIVLSSDQFGKLDVFYQENDKNIAFTSNLDLLPENPAKNGFNQVALAHTLTYYGHRPAKKDTLYNSVKRLGIDEVANVQNGQLKIKKQQSTIQNQKIITTVIMMNTVTFL